MTQNNVRLKWYIISINLSPRGGSHNFSGWVTIYVNPLQPTNEEGTVSPWLRPHTVTDNISVFLCSIFCSIFCSILFYIFCSILTSYLATVLISASLQPKILLNFDFLLLWIFLCLNISVYLVLFAFNPFPLFIYILCLNLHL